jgi:hypothetical protein
MKAHSFINLTAGLVLAVSLTSCNSQQGKDATTGESATMNPAPAHGASAAPAASNLKFTPPAEWIVETPTSTMRKAQYRLPRVNGDPEDAELSVFYFPGEGGSVEANIDRWKGQFQNTDGSPATGIVSRRESHGIPVTVVDVKGIYLAGNGMMGESKPKPNFRMLAAVAETSAGPWFFKLTGPGNTIAKWEPSFQSFLDTIQ